MLKTSFLLLIKHYDYIHELSFEFPFSILHLTFCLYEKYRFMEKLHQINSYDLIKAFDYILQF